MAFLAPSSVPERKIPQETPPHNPNKMTVITLVAAGGAKVDVDEEIAMLCEPFKKCLSVEDDDGKDIKCEDINERVLKEAMRFVETHEKDEKFGIDHPLTPEDERFFEVSSEGSICLLIS